MGLLFDLLELKGFDPKQIVWMPAHTSRADVGTKRIGDGSFLTGTDRQANSLADTQAKLAAAQFAVPLRTRQILDHYDSQVRLALKMLGRVTWASTHLPPNGSRDSEASRARANAARTTARASYAGGNTTGTAGAKKQSTKFPLQAKVSRWILLAGKAPRDSTLGAAVADAGVNRTLHHKSHRLMRSGDVAWCAVCGAYASTRGVGLAKPCTGPVPFAAGGRSQQLRRLKKGWHPKLKVRLPQAVPFDQKLRPEVERNDQQPYLGDAERLKQTAMGRLQLKLRWKLFNRKRGYAQIAGNDTGDEPTTDDAMKSKVRRLIEAARGNDPTLPTGPSKCGEVRTAIDTNPSDPPAAGSTAGGGVDAERHCDGFAVSGLRQTPTSGLANGGLATTARASGGERPSDPAQPVSNGRHHPALCRSKLRLKHRERRPPGAPSSSRYEEKYAVPGLLQDIQRWEPGAEQDSDDDMDPSIRTTAATAQKWRPPTLLRSGVKRSHDAGDPAQPCSPSDPQGRRRRTG